MREWQAASPRGKAYPRNMMIGATLSHYRILEKIGTGGMGEVYRAWDERLERDVALKLLPAGLVADEAARRRFHKEALALSKLSHPNVATVYDFDTEDGVAFLVMEYVAGITLDDKLLSGLFPENEVVRLGVQLAEGLAAAHEQGVIHRDIKPGNIHLMSNGRLKILDFGLAKLLRPASEMASTDNLTESQAIAGTLPYMAPEQLRGHLADARSDIWSAGVVLYEMAIGRRPFQEKFSAALAADIIHKQPPRPRQLRSQLSQGLEFIIVKCLEKEPENRYQSVKELLVDLKRLAMDAGSFPAQGSTVSSARPKRRGRRKRIQSLAVLPLANLSRDPDQEYFVDGMTEALISNLAKLRAVRVISRTSAMRYKGIEKSAPAIAKELNVDAVVEGSVWRVGDRVRIAAQLIDAASDMHLWAESYERNLEDVLLLQSDVAEAIARKIQVALSPEETRRLVAPRRVDPEAYQAYLKGRFHWYKLTPEAFQAALYYFNLALEKDPKHALALTGIADLWGAAGVWGFVRPREAISKAYPAALKAVDADDTLAEAHEILARIKLFYEWDWPAAEKESQRAIALNPQSAEVGLAYCFLLLSTKRFAEATVQIERVLELDPLHLYFQSLRGCELLYVSRYDEAIGWFRKALATEANFVWPYWGLWSAFHQKAMFEEALAEATQFYALLGESEVAAAMKNLHARTGYRGALRLGAEMLVEQATLRYVQPIRIARLYARAEEKEQALEWLEKAYEERDPFLAQLSVDVDWNSLRSTPRFRDLLRRMNFPH